MEIKTLGEVSQILKEHGLEGTYCPKCDQFAQARVLLKQDKVIFDMYEALKITIKNLDDGFANKNLALKTMIEKAIPKASSNPGFTAKEAKEEK